MTPVSSHTSSACDTSAKCRATKSSATGADRPLMPVPLRLSATSRRTRASTGCAPRRRTRTSSTRSSVCRRQWRSWTTTPHPQGCPRVHRRPERRLTSAHHLLGEFEFRSTSWNAGSSPCLMMRTSMSLFSRTQRSGSLRDWCDPSIVAFRRLSGRVGAHIHHLVRGEVRVTELAVVLVMMQTS